NSSYISTISDEKFVDNQDNYCICPYDKCHRVLRIRFATHLARCEENYPSIQLARCPFDITHRMPKEDLKEHIESCNARRNFDCHEFPEKLTKCLPVVECDENWDVDPPVSSYNPQAYCEQNMIMRTINGVSKSKRQAFRESERQRLKKFDN
ncbi:hypothetical protein KR093_010306, partial [Drosophila rubida]